jgi:hypothetical protein
MVSAPYCINKRGKNKERTHCSRPEAHSAMHPSWRLDDPEIEVVFGTLVGWLSSRNVNPKQVEDGAGP